ncbi:PIG-L deacetylase family protein [Streptomyces sp. NPDC005438]|uniref:PIG-L deacetylase family protein n=1 Tax=Streptomyces sp. NPDC005438 TaxID=3156880 RepID=UPI0033AF8F97
MDEDLARMPEDWRRALAVVAHPDDLEYGGAAAVAEWVAQGREIRYLLVTHGEAGIDGLEPGRCARVREAEQRASAAAVGVREVEFLDHRDGIIEEGPRLRADIAEAVRRHQPELVITLNHHDQWGHGAWNTPDHRAVGRSVLDAVGDAGNRWIFPEQLRASGQREALTPWGGVRWVAVAGSPHADHQVEVSETSFEAAVSSLCAHDAYIRGLGEGDPVGYARDFLAMTMRQTSAEDGGRWAVSFELFPR